ncbi:MAPEG family protein [Pollutimonas sp. M17]|uniref:MAPEG family protein n=1 Tax=Pollutimonas sp. M17 TaxID=2962065 RepID=UPI0021F4F0BA|nr:MAPEG family protein [Pollutimonas sp. M17]UYO94882.1 MAPEG family protein [Pollutimonas sp. M17]
MTLVAWLLLVAALLPLLASAASKAGGKAYDNDNPRAWLARQEGWRARANAAQVNLFEGLPFFFAAVLFALYRQADPQWVAGLMAAWIALRLIYLGVYIAGYGSLRTLIWALALVLNMAMLFAGG